VSAHFAVKKSIKKLIRFGLNKEQILSSLKSSPECKDIREPILAALVSQTCSEYPDYESIQELLRSKIIIDRMAEDNHIILVDPLRRTVEKYDKSRAFQMLDPKVDLRDRIYTCKLDYNPLKSSFLYRENRVWKYNNYVPPEWKRDHFYSCGEVPVVKTSEIPSLYRKFLMHLVNNHVGSFNYILDWLANAIQARNYCILTTIGKQGIGKGMLGEIMKLIVGNENYAKTDNRLLDKEFNSQINNKVIVYLDEIEVRKTSQENKLKDLINNHIEVEKKGVDAKMTKNYASFYLSSNNLDAIKIPADDRRFSIVELTSSKLYTVMTSAEISSLLDPSNVAEFARFLYYRKVDPEKMLRVFKTTRSIELRLNNLKGWQEWFIEDYCFDHAGEDILIDDVKQIIQEKFGFSIAPGRPAFQKLETLFPERFRVKSRKFEDRENPDKKKTRYFLQIQPWEDLNV